MEMEEKEKNVLEQILEENKKRTFYARIAAAAATASLAVLIVCLLILLPRVNRLITDAEETLVSVQSSFAEMENAAAGLSGMSENIIATSTGLNDFVEDNSQAVSEAMEQMKNIDYEGLNQAIKDLQDAVEPFAKFVNRFK